MAQSLYDAAIQGDTAALLRLLEDDPNIIDRNYLNCEDKNVLHISAMLGHEEFMEAILQINSTSSYNMCWARDRDGRNPLHLAAINGRINILKLVNTNNWLMGAAMEKADQGRTILHLCVKHNQLETLKLLLEIFTNIEFVGAKNEDGLTILHQALNYNQNKMRKQMIIYLIENKPQIINIKTGEGRTALDIYMGQANVGSEGDQEITNSFHRSKAKHSTSRTRFEEMKMNLEKNKDAIMIVASIIATMAFQALVSPPGGVWQESLLEGPNPHKAGESVAVQTHPKAYKNLIFCNSVAFVLSFVTIIMLLVGNEEEIGYTLGPLAMSVGSISIAYAMSLEITVGDVGKRMKNMLIFMVVGYLISVSVYLCWLSSSYSSSLEEANENEEQVDQRV